jgi:DNA-binding response OmpR family regulator
MQDDDLLNILSNKKVLYSEDEDGIRENVVEILELFFEDVTSVSDGLEVIDEMSLNYYDVVILDICMPNMDGLEAIKKIRETNKKIPIIILSAHTEQEYLWRAVELKITKYLTKPYDKDLLIDALKKCALELTDNEVSVVLKDNYTYDTCTKTLHHNKENIKLSKNESRLLEYFINNANLIVTFEDIYNYIWQYDPPTKEAMKSLIKDIRKKVGKEFIKNVHGIGYIFEL